MAEAETKKAKHETAEHVAWDCSDVVPRVRILARHCRQHLDKAKDTPDIQHELMVAMGNLVKVPAVALMLPAMSEELKAALREVSDKGIELLAAAETSLWDSPRMLFILSLRETDMRSPVAQLQGLLEAVAECTLKVKAKQGPWLWPLHEPDVSASLLLCDAMNDTENCCMRALRMMRILPSVCLKEQQQHIREQYSASTTYVFAWTEVYMQAMWALLILVVPLAIALPVVPDLLGASSWGFYTLQAIVLVWTMTLGALSRSRRAFVNDGSSLARSEKAVNWEHFDHSRRSKLRRVLQMTGTGNEFAEVVNVRQNPDHWHSENPKTWRFLSVAVTVLAGLLCLTLAGISLLAVMELKFMLIFEWGECFRLECIGPEDMHGFGGLLSMIGTDIILALLLNVATGELCKAFAFHIAKFWNFKQMISRQICFYITASSIDVLAGIGVFSYLAFSFLPEWEQTVVSSWDDSSMCVGMWDYDVCRVMRGCAEGDSVCCSGTLFCARAKAPVTQRRSLFEAWLGGLFMVAPFVEVLIQFLVPVLAYYIHLKADHIQNDDERDPGRRKSCCCCFLEGLGRLVAFIFLLDGGVMGLPYVWRGYPFAAPNVQHEDPRKKAVLGPVCDGCKRDMHWTDADKDWSCRHHHRCRNDLASKGPERWCCRICQSDICGS
ncbi:unnamed protein product [Effrenium voratum]|uniref:Uncharacterized protein n=1 Tax=Effrenium voratum TaxID=2562239 RepID=A0AA36HYZ8_9DINO|nr:unnamed protein product [Effrenium voratum]